MFVWLIVYFDGGEQKLVRYAFNNQESAYAYAKTYEDALTSWHLVQFELIEVVTHK